MGRVSAILFVVAVVVLPSIGSAQKILKWTDANGVVHYGDSIPPEYANRDRELLNDQGVPIGSEEGERTEEQAAAKAARERAAEEEKSARDAIERHDRMLLQTYLSVADIEALRNQRLELLDSEIKLLEVTLDNLRKKLVDLHTDASNFKPYATRPDAPQIPEALAREITQTTSSISSYEATLVRKKTERAAVKKSFDADIARFIEIKGH